MKEEGPRRYTKRELVGMQPLPPQTELPRLSNETLRAWYIFNSPVARFSAALFGVSLLTKEQKTPQPEITMVYGSLVISPSTDFHFRTSSLATDG